MADRTPTITWLGHSTFLVESAAGTRILLEGFVESCPTCPEQLHGGGLGDLDLILITHGHADHCADAAAHQQRTGAVMAGMVELMGWLGHNGADSSRLIDFNKGGSINVNGITVTMTDAAHSASAPDGSYAGEPAGFVVELEDGYRMYHAGDTAVFGDMRLIGDLYTPHLAMLPIGDHYTMDPRGAAKAVELLGVREVLGMHYGTFPPLTGRPSQLRELVGANVTVHELQPGETLAPALATT
jgi:L-ascorbate metabolism protein UlaG (beta-lactamase superfamily)